MDISLEPTVSQHSQEPNVTVARQSRPLLYPGPGVSRAPEPSLRPADCRPAIRQSAALPSRPEPHSLQATPERVPVSLTPHRLEFGSIVWLARLAERPQFKPAVVGTVVAFGFGLIWLFVL
jgi:hypothetical protein